MAYMTVGSKYTPFTFEEALKPVGILQQQYDRNTAEKDKALDNLDTMESTFITLQSKIPNSSDVQTEYNTIINDIKTLSDGLAESHKLTDGDKRKFADIRKRANNLTARVDNAYSRYNTYVHNKINLENKGNIILDDYDFSDFYDKSTLETVPRSLNLDNYIEGFRAGVLGVVTNPKYTKSSISPIEGDDNFVQKLTSVGLSPAEVGDNNDINTLIDKTIDEIINAHDLTESQQKTVRTTVEKQLKGIAANIATKNYQTSISSVKRPEVDSKNMSIYDYSKLNGITRGSQGFSFNEGIFDTDWQLYTDEVSQISMVPKNGEVTKNEKTHHINAYELLQYLRGGESPKVEDTGATAVQKDIGLTNFTNSLRELGIDPSDIELLKRVPMSYNVYDDNGMRRFTYRFSKEEFKSNPLNITKTKQSIPSKETAKNRA
jgi:hypothetical protein